jgi:hypothetical protein
MKSVRKPYNKGSVILLSAKRKRDYLLFTIGVEIITYGSRREIDDCFAEQDDPWLAISLKQIV